MRAPIFCARDAFSVNVVARQVKEVWARVAERVCRLPDCYANVTLMRPWGLVRAA